MLHTKTASYEASYPPGDVNPHYVRLLPIVLRSHLLLPDQVAVLVSAAVRMISFTVAGMGLYVLDLC